MNKANEGDQFLNQVDAEKIKIMQRKTVNLEAELAETLGELDKSRHLLITQVKINDDYKKEVLLIQSKMEENKAEFDVKMLEYAQLLDIRAARIKKLERQLKDIAYGTKQVRIPSASHVGPMAVGAAGDKRRDSFSFVGQTPDHMMDNQLVANLERGQNIFEIHLTKVSFIFMGQVMVSDADSTFILEKSELIRLLLFNLIQIIRLIMVNFFLYRYVLVNTIRRGTTHHGRT